MARDINTKKLKKNAFRYSKVRGETASRIRIPGGVINAGSMARIAEVAEKYGNGTIFVTNRQGVELPGIALEDMDAVNKMIQSIIDDSGVNQEERDKGYPASGTRNVVACPGQRLCGCSNDCGKVRMDDFGFIGMTEPQYDPSRCVSCEQCIKYCNIRSVGALSLVNGKVVRDTAKCIGCGVCVAYCPTRAWTRSKEHYFRVVIMGRTGKKNPRLAEDFVKWADEESIFKMVKNAYAYVEEYIDPNALEGKEHIGYIVDRTGFDEFCKWVLKDVHLNEKAEVASRVYWGGKHYDRSNNLM